MACRISNSYSQKFPGIIHQILYLDEETYKNDRDGCEQPTWLLMCADTLTHLSLLCEVVECIDLIKVIT